MKIFVKSQDAYEQAREHVSNVSQQVVEPQKNLLQKIVDGVWNVGDFASRILPDPDGDILDIEGRGLQGHVKDQMEMVKKNEQQFETIYDRHSQAYTKKDLYNATATLIDESGKKISVVISYFEGDNAVVSEPSTPRKKWKVPFESLEDIQKPVTAEHKAPPSAPPAPTVPPPVTALNKSKYISSEFSKMLINMSKKKVN